MTFARTRCVQRVFQVQGADNMFGLSLWALALLARVRQYTFTEPVRQGCKVFDMVRMFQTGITGTWSWMKMCRVTVWESGDRWREVCWWVSGPGGNLTKRPPGTVSRIAWLSGKNHMIAMKHSRNMTGRWLKSSFVFPRSQHHFQRWTAEYEELLSSKYATLHLNEFPNRSDGCPADVYKAR